MTQISTDTSQHNLEIPSRSRNWMRCFVIQGKDRERIAQGVVFSDNSVVVRGTDGHISIYPNSDDYEKTLAPDNWFQVRDVDDWAGIEELVKKPEKENLEQAINKLMGTSFSYSPKE